MTASSNDATQAGCISQNYVLPDFPAAQLIVAEGMASEYLAMRSAQVSALLQLLCSGAPGQCEERSRTQLLWLAAGFAKEVEHFIPVALSEVATPPFRES